MFCLKDTLKGQATRFCHSRVGSQNPHLISPFAKGEKQRGGFLRAGSRGLGRNDGRIL